MHLKTDENGEGKLTATVTPYFENIMRTDLNLEIEMLQGIRTKLPDGMIQYELTIPPEKSALVMEFMLMVIAKDMHSNESRN